MTKSCKLNAPKHRWTDSELSMLRRDYPDTPTAKIAEAMGVTPYVVSGKAGKRSESGSQPLIWPALPLERRVMRRDTTETRR